MKTYLHAALKSCCQCSPETGSAQSAPPSKELIIATAVIALLSAFTLGAMAVKGYPLSFHEWQWAHLPFAVTVVCSSTSFLLLIRRSLLMAMRRAPVASRPPAMQPSFSEPPAKATPQRETRAKRASAPSGGAGDYVAPTPLRSAMKKRERVQEAQGQRRTVKLELPLSNYINAREGGTRLYCFYNGVTRSITFTEDATVSHLLDYFRNEGPATAVNWSGKNYEPSDRLSDHFQAEITLRIL